jgi:hypothetical protein
MEIVRIRYFVIAFLCRLGCSAAVTIEEKRPQYLAEIENEIIFHAFLGFE